MFLGFMIAFCSAASVYGVWAILRDYRRGRVEGRGFGFDKATQPVGYNLLMTVNCIAVALFVTGDFVLGFFLLRRLILV